MISFSTVNVMELLASTCCEIYSLPTETTCFDIGVETKELTSLILHFEQNQKWIDVFLYSEII